MKQIEVQIMGQAYVLGCPEGGEAHLRQAVARVDTAMGKIRDSGKVKARDRLAVLAALNIAFELEQAQLAIPPVPDAPAEPDPALAEPHSPSGSSESPPTAPDTPSMSPAPDADWHKRLIAKLDDALNQDGRLL